ncbi:hypothetical protein ABZ725_28870 [Streptomyces sp. NPDC006872]|uniref:hypothetical protein n=1 Tax=Streptomyces sp. NPDC006872 TaxID=3155720 RepID=UPI0033D946B0
MLIALRRDAVPSWDERPVREFVRQQRLFKEGRLGAIQAASDRFAHIADCTVRQTHAGGRRAADTVNRTQPGQAA